VEAQRNLAIELSKQLCDQGNSVHIVTKKLHGLPSEEKAEGLYFHRYPSALFCTFVLHRIKELDKKYSFDIVLGQDLVSRKSYVVAATLSQRLKIPTVSYVCLQPSLTYRDWFTALRGYPKEAVMRLAEFTPSYINVLGFSSVMKIVTSSYFLRDRLTQTFNLQKDKIEVISPFINLKRFATGLDEAKTVRQKLGIDNRTELILFIGTHWIFRGEDEFLKAISLVFREFPKAKALLVVPSKLPSRIQKLIRKLSIESSLIFVQGTKDLTIPALLSASDVYVFCGLSSVSGGSIDPPLTIIEAIAAGTPCVAYNIGGIKELKDFKGVHLVEPNNVGDLASAIIGVLRKRDRTEEKKSGVLEGSAFDSRTATRRFLSIFEKLVDGHKD
jgi:glycosyltransferase involved in cell wall biosynthesis